MKKIDFRSDTVTQPTKEMRQIMANAIVGDDVFEEDPTINQLEEKSAKLFGKEAALFVSSGTMGNLICMLVYCGRGAELIAGDQSHIIHYEVAGMSALGGIMPRVVPNQADGTMRLEDIQKQIRIENVHFPETKLICIENTHNRCNGTPLSLEYAKSVYKLAKSNDLKIHTDGARIFNVSEKLGISVKDYAKFTDSLTFCLSKGLGCPVGSVIVGDKDFIKKARKQRKMLGGGMRQAGILAAAGIHALENHIDRLNEDHTHIIQLIDFMDQHPKIHIEKPSANPTNILYFSLINSDERFIKKLLSALKEQGILMIEIAPNRIRMVTHIDISAKDVQFTIKAFEEVLK